MKRMLRMAAQGGYDALSWDTGDTNAERYNLSQAVDKINLRWNPSSNTYQMVAMKGKTIVREESGLGEEALAAMIGKDAAQNGDIPPGDDDPNHIVKLAGQDLKIGGAGMRGFYDDILPKTVAKLVKKWGSSVEPGTVAGLPRWRNTTWLTATIRCKELGQFDGTLAHSQVRHRAPER